VAPGDLVLDVGAGDGSLTELLVSAGARVIAVELHQQRARMLRERFCDGPVRVVSADAADLWLPRRPFRVVANPPFGVSMALLRRLTAPGSRLLAADIVLPRHIARQWCEGDVRGAARWGAQFDLSLGMRVPSSAFRPSIERDAVVLRIRRAGVHHGGPRRPGRGQRVPPLS
jgi:23S rRNA (adenine-N6)-dimethyltransferase